jgi:hypothetical protein
MARASVSCLLRLLAGSDSRQSDGAGFAQSMRTAGNWARVLSAAADPLNRAVLLLQSAQQQRAAPGIAAGRLNPIPHPLKHLLSSSSVHFTKQQQYCHSTRQLRVQQALCAWDGLLTRHTQHRVVV